MLVTLYLWQYYTYISVEYMLHRWCLVLKRSRSYWTVFPRCWTFHMKMLTTLSSSSCCCCLHSKSENTLRILCCVAFSVSSLCFIMKNQLEPWMHILWTYVKDKNLFGLGLGDGVRERLLLHLHGRFGEQLYKLLKVHVRLLNILPHCWRRSLPEKHRRSKL